MNVITPDVGALRKILKGLATERGKPYYLVTKHNPRENSEGLKVPYGIAVEDATDWERKNAKELELIEPDRIANITVS